MAVHLWFDLIIRWIPHGPHALPVSDGSRTGISNVFHILRDPYGTRKVAARHFHRHVREWTYPDFAKIRHGRHMWSYGPLTLPARTVHGLFTTFIPVRGPQAYNACNKTLRAPYGKAKFVRCHTGPVRLPWVDVRFLFKTAREQYGARECDVTAACYRQLGFGNCLVNFDINSFDIS